MARPKKPSASATPPTAPALPSQAWRETREPLTPARIETLKRGDKLWVRKRTDFSGPPGTLYFFMTRLPKDGNKPGENLLYRPDLATPVNVSDNQAIDTLDVMAEVGPLRPMTLRDALLMPEGSLVVHGPNYNQYPVKDERFWWAGFTPPDPKTHDYLMLRFANLKGEITDENYSGLGAEVDEWLVPLPPREPLVPTDPASVQVGSWIYTRRLAPWVAEMPLLVETNNAVTKSLTLLAPDSTEINVPYEDAPTTTLMEPPSGAISAPPAPVAPRPVEDKLPLVSEFFPALREGQPTWGARNDAALRLTIGKEYAIRHVIMPAQRSDKKWAITVVMDDGHEADFTEETAHESFLVRLSDFPSLPVPEAPTMPDTLPQPQEQKETAQIATALMRDRPLPPPDWNETTTAAGRIQHNRRKRALFAFRRLMGKRVDGGDYVSGLWANPEPDSEMTRILKAGWLVRDGSTILMGIAGTGKTTLTSYGTRLMCGAPPRLEDTDHGRKGRLRLGGPVNGRWVDATPENFARLIEEEARNQGAAWPVPRTAERAVEMMHLKRGRKSPPKPGRDLANDAYWRPGTPDDVKRAWRIRDAQSDDLDEEGEPLGQSGVTPEDAAFASLVFGSYYDYFRNSFIGIAKNDLEKRSEEILYQSKLLNVEYKRSDLPPDLAITGSFGALSPESTIRETIILPQPQPIVTAVVKFLNEANRMSRAVGDTFLGLMAEKEVEFRGATFRSPDSVWWLDMNPHLGWGALDWAFLDRVDVACIIPTAQLSTKIAYEDTRSGRRAAINAAYVDDTPEFSLDELQDLWSDVERVDLGGYWEDDLIEDMAALNPSWTPLSAEDKEQRLPHPAYDPIKAVKMGAAILEFFIATPRGYDWSRFVPHPAMAANPMRPTDGPGAHYTNLYNMMLKNELGTTPGSLGQAAVFAKLDRPFGYRATASLVKFSRAVAWLNKHENVTEKDLLTALPFVLSHRLAPSKDTSGIKDYFSTYDWLTHTEETKTGRKGVLSMIESPPGGAPGGMLVRWKKGLARLYMIQSVQLALLDETSELSEETRDKLIEQVDKWLTGGGAGSRNVESMKQWASASSGGSRDYVMGQMVEAGSSLYAQLEGLKYHATLRDMRRALTAGKATSEDLDRWDRDLQRIAAVAGLKAEEETELRRLIGEARNANVVTIAFIDAPRDDAAGVGALTMGDWEPATKGVIELLFAQPQNRGLIQAGFEAFMGHVRSANSGGKTTPDETVELAPATKSRAKNADRARGSATLHHADNNPLTVQVVLSMATREDAEKVRALVTRVGGA